MILSILCCLFNSIIDSKFYPILQQYPDPSCQNTYACESDIIHMNLNPSNGYYRFTGLLHWIVLTVKYEFAIQHDQMVILPEQ